MYENKSFSVASFGSEDSTIRDDAPQRQKLCKGGGYSSKNDIIIDERTHSVEPFLRSASFLFFRNDSFSLLKTNELSCGNIISLLQTVQAFGFLAEFCFEKLAFTLVYICLWLPPHEITFTAFVLCVLAMAYTQADARSDARIESVADFNAKNNDEKPSLMNATERNLTDMIIA
ncbi:MAG: hypothetical protein K2M99_08720 [Treponemataceae bacterium]|nr:hypothetical protein [Treponemataceae bacterium]